MKKDKLIMPTEEEDLRIHASIAADPDTYELTDNEFARMRPVSEVHPDIPKRVRGLQKKPIKTLTTLRLDEEIMNFFKASGKGWQTRINEALREYIKSHDVV